MAKSGIKHADVGDELSKAEWLDEENHELLHGDSFPGTPAERQLFYRDDEHKWYIYNGTAWVSLQAAGGSADHLDDIGDVNVPTPSDGDFVEWDTGTSKWIKIAHKDATTGVHGVGAKHVAAIAAAGNEAPLKTAFEAHKARHENAGADEISLAALSGDPADTINKSLLTTAGDIIKRGAAAPERLVIGTNGHVLTVVTGAPAWAAASGGGGTKIEDADSDTKVDVEESADEDKIRMDVGGTEAFLLHDDGILDLAKQSRIHVYRNTNQTITTGTWTKIQFNTETYDNQNEFDPTTNYRFTATKAGHYSVALTGLVLAMVADKRSGVSLKKNGAFVALSLSHASHAADAATFLSAILYLAASDYIEAFVYHDAGSSKDLSGDSPSHTFMMVHKLS